MRTGLGPGGVTAGVALKLVTGDELPLNCERAAATAPPDAGRGTGEPPTGELAPEEPRKLPGIWILPGRLALSRRPTGGWSSRLSACKAAAGEAGAGDDAPAGEAGAGAGDASPPLLTGVEDLAGEPKAAAASARSSSTRERAASAAARIWETSIGSEPAGTMSWVSPRTCSWRGICDMLEARKTSPEMPPQREASVRPGVTKNRKSEDT
ncbi:hypothetical protein CAOG_010003 [Capsaspora owczarzaki ATCC 30864]|uniref:Uncharacterized protein n=1 Tax=Capsaspora owczarzaki (strain ATCC 30864) TaxID=595528 RepID=A0A0D2WVI6_CAPO3|nr:hypothetical protein CAOG_010003 [Capsaspora owczarzaki ATCC 30864]